MKEVQTAEDYIAAHSAWRDGLVMLVSLLRDTELDESIKWGTPHYTLDGKIVVGIAAFKHHFALWFHQGAFLKDPEGLLYNAQEGKTKGLRQIRFTDPDQIDSGVLQAYIEEAISNERAGKSIDVAEPGKYAMPPILDQALSGNAALKKAFYALTPGRQKEYAEYISSAKRIATRESRLEKILPMIRNGLGLNDKYRE